jgi:ABC-type Na+ efflux pump permease subunit
VSVTVVAVLGAFQFVPTLRGRRSWHRVAGRVLVPAGLLVALSALWMALFSAPPPTDGTLLRVLRLVLLLVFGSAMLASILLGTQAFLLIIPELFGTLPDALTGGTLSAAAWLLNLVIAESVIRRRVRANARGARR